MIKTLYPIFQHWSNTGSIFLISDTHFYDIDRSLMGYQITEQEQIYLLESSVHKGDTLIHLGDVGNPILLNKLKCYKVLIMGNHDNSDTKQYFNEVYNGPLWIAEKLILSHEPLNLKLDMTMTPVAFNIHGHNHNKEFLNDNYHLNIAQNVFGYFPLNLKYFIQSGILKKIDSIHRAAINKQIEEKKVRETFFSN